MIRKVKGKKVDVSSIAETSFTLNSIKSTESIVEWNWFDLSTLLAVPRVSLLKGVYANPPITAQSFSSTTPLTTRLRHSDLLLYSLLSILLPSPSSTLPRFPSLLQTPTDLKSFRNELSKCTEKVLKLEKESNPLNWDNDIVWRRSFLDESKGGKWEKVLFLLTILSLRKVVNDMVLKEGEVKVGSNAEVTEVYNSEFEKTTRLLEERELDLATLRQKGFELLQANAEHSSSSSSSTAIISTPYSELDLDHLRALRDQKLRKHSKDLWNVRNQVVISHASGSLKAKSSSNTIKAKQFLTSSNAQVLIQKHQQLLNSLRNLSDLPKPQSSTDIPFEELLIITQPTPSSSAPTTLTTPTVSLESQFLFDFNPPPSSFTSNSPHNYLIRTTQASSNDLDLSVAMLLDSLNPNPPSPPPPPLSILTVKQKPSKLPLTVPPIELKKSTSIRKVNKVETAVPKRKESLSSSPRIKITPKKKETELDKVRSRLDFDSSTRDISMIGGNGMRKEAESLLDELLDEGGMDDSYY